MIDKWLTLGITTDEAQAFRLIEDACRDAGDYGYYKRIREELAIGISARGRPAPLPGAFGKRR